MPKIIENKFMVAHVRDRKGVGWLERVPGGNYFEVMELFCTLPWWWLHESTRDRIEKNVHTHTYTHTHAHTSA